MLSQFYLPMDPLSPSGKSIKKEVVNPGKHGNRDIPKGPGYTRKDRAPSRMNAHKDIGSPRTILVFDREIDEPPLPHGYLHPGSIRGNRNRDISRPVDPDLPRPFRKTLPEKSPLPGSGGITPGIDLKIGPLKIVLGIVSFIK